VAGWRRPPRSSPWEAAFGGLHQAAAYIPFVLSIQSILHYVFRYVYRYHEAGAYTNCLRSKCAYLRLHIANHVPQLACECITSKWRLLHESKHSICTRDVYMQACSVLHVSFTRIDKAIGDLVDPSVHAMFSTEFFTFLVSSDTRSRPLLYKGLMKQGWRPSSDGGGALDLVYSWVLAICCSLHLDWSRI
jgi:hypothetical protein